MVADGKKSKKKVQGLRISSFVTKLAKTVGTEGISIKGETLDVIQQLLVGLLDQISGNLNMMMKVPGSKKTIKADQVKVAAELTFGLEAPELASQVFELADSSVAAVKAGEAHNLIFAVPRISRYFRCQLSGYCNTATKNPKRFQVTVRRTGKGLGACITSVIQGICLQILETSAERLAGNGKRTRLTTRDLFLAIVGHPELKSIFREFVTQGGVTETTQPKKARKAKGEGVGGDDGAAAGGEGDEAAPAKAKKGKKTKKPAAKAKKVAKAKGKPKAAPKGGKKGKAKAAPKGGKSGKAKGRKPKPKEE